MTVDDIIVAVVAPPHALLQADLISNFSQIQAPSPTPDPKFQIYL